MILEEQIEKGLRAVKTKSQMLEYMMMMSRRRRRGMMMSMMMIMFLMMMLIPRMERTPESEVLGGRAPGKICIVIIIIVISIIIIIPVAKYHHLNWCCILLP